MVAEHGKESKVNSIVHSPKDISNSYDERELSWLYDRQLDALAST